MKTVPSTVYDKNYYTKICLGSSEFEKSNGKKLSDEVLKLLANLKINNNDKVLDIGCGRGDITIHIARKAKLSTGIDYSKAGILLANKAKSHSKLKNVRFFEMNATKLAFKDNEFDKVIAIDVLEHLTQKEVQQMMKEIKRVLKPNGIFFAHTGTNKILYELTYPYYIRPINLIIRSLDINFFNKKYEPLPKDPRTEVEKIQHVNEPTLFYLKKLFKKYKFEGSINTRVGYLKKDDNFKHNVYNFLSALYPFSKTFPLNIFFGWAFICQMRNVKS